MPCTVTLVAFAHATLDVQVKLLYVDLIKIASAEREW